MPKVYTHFDEPPMESTPNGSQYLELFQEEINRDGTRGLVGIGKKNVYDIIQEDLESTKIENILKAVAAGDLSVLRTQEPTYIDATTLPKSLMEAQNIIVKAQSEFEKFPQEVKDLFANSAEIYVNEMGTKEFLEKMAPYNEKIKSIQDAGSVKEYNKKVAEQAKFEMDVAAAKGGTE